MIVTYVVKDSCGNSSTFYHVQVVKDEEGPTSTLATNATHDTVKAAGVECLSASITAKTTIGEVITLFGITDNCTRLPSSFSFTSSREVKTNNCADSVIVTYVVNDSCGNSGTFYHVQVVKDEEGPTSTLATNATHDTVKAAGVECLSASITAKTTIGEVITLFGITDNCTRLPSSFSFTSSREVKTNNCTDSVIVTYVVQDSCGNSGTLYHVQVVKDETAPTLTGTWPADITNQNNCFANRDISGLLSDAAVAALYSDNCGGTVTATHGEDAVSGNDCGWTVTRTYTISDACGNKTTKTMSVSGKDQTAPTLTGTWPADITNQNNCYANRDISGLLSDADAAALYEDNCGGAVTANHTEVSDVVTGNDCGWTVTRTYTISDACGNKTTKQMSVSGKDQTAPSLTGTWPANITNQNNCFANRDISGLLSDAAVAALYSDNCGGTVTATHGEDAVSGDDCSWTVTRTYTISDACGNTTTKTMSVSGGDKTAPAFTAPDDIAVCRNSDNTYTITPDVTGNVTDAADNCATPAVTYEDAAPVANADGTLTIVRTWKATDDCGLSAEKEQTITINPLPAITAAPLSQNITYGGSITPVVIGNAYSNVSLSTLPGGLTYNSSTQTISGMPAASGTYTVTATATSNTTPGCGTVEQEITIVVGQKPLTLELDSTKLYDGEQFEVLYNQLHVSGLLDGDALVAGTMLSESAAIGQYENHDGSFQATLDAGIIYKSGFSIRNASNADVTASYIPTFNVKLEILPSTITITAATDSKVYDGTPLTNSGYTLTDGVLAYDDQLVSCQVIGSQLCLGTSDNVPGNAVIMRDGTDVTAFYTIHYVNGTLTVTEPSGFSCPDPETFLMNDCETSMEVTLAGTPTLPDIAAGHYTLTNNLTPLTIGTHTVTWSLLDDCGNELATCDQTVTVDYKPCTGVTWQGYPYGAVRVGSQCWLTENIRWSTGTHSAYDENEANVEKFGYLYTWYTAVGVEEGDETAVPETKSGNCGEPYVQGICPDGWGVGSEADFELLNTTAGSTDALKDMSTLYWQSGFEGTAPNTGFNARGGGWYNSALARYEDLLTGYHFWRSDSTPGSTAFSSSVTYWCSDIVNNQSRKTDKMSVRCIRKAVP